MLPLGQSSSEEGETAESCKDLEELVATLNSSSSKNSYKRPILPLVWRSLTSNRVRDSAGARLEGCGQATPDYTSP